jgi:DNA-binding PadR family transcriptional regulator
VHLPAAEKDALLLRLASGAPSTQAELQRRFRLARAPHAAAARPGERTVADLLAAAEERFETRSQQEAERQAAERARYLDSLVGQEEALWRQIDDLIETKRAREYDQAVRILQDLSALADHVGERAAFAARLTSLRSRYAKRSSLLERIDRADLLA